MRSIDRQACFPQSGPEELSVLSWNLLAECHYDDYAITLDWQTERWPLLRQWLVRFAACDVLCFQEVDRERMLLPLQEALAEYGFAAVVQDRGEFPVVNATFYKDWRFGLAWVDHRSRALLLGLTLADGRQLGLANVHLQAGAGRKDEEQRRFQLSSAVSRLQRRKPWCVVACGDFNSALRSDSELAVSLADAGLAKAPSSGFTYAVDGYMDTLDHVWAGKALRAKAVLASGAAVLRGIERTGLPDSEHPSDHLPVAVMFGFERAAAPAARAPAPLAVEAPGSLSEAVRHEWLSILWLADAGPATKARRKEQRRLEAAFLATLGEEEAASLRRWQDSAVSAARGMVEGAVARACASLGPACGSSRPAERKAAAGLGSRAPPGQIIRWQGG